MRYCHFPGDHNDRPYDRPEPAVAAMIRAKVGANLVFARPVNSIVFKIWCQAKFFLSKMEGYRFFYLDFTFSL
jgi:hypothetical protein